MLKPLIKSTLKAACVAAAPLCSKKSTMDEQTARSVLEAASARPGGTALWKNTILPPTCDLQIIIPAYNVEDYLAECMDSVLSQQTKYDFRVVPRMPPRPLRTGMPMIPGCGSFIRKTGASPEPEMWPWRRFSDGI